MDGFCFQMLRRNNLSENFCHTLMIFCSILECVQCVQPLHYILVFKPTKSSQEVIKDLLLVVLSDEHERLVMEGQFTQYYGKFQLSNRILICLIVAKLP